MMLEEFLAGAFVAGLALLAGKAIHDDPDGVKERLEKSVQKYQDKQAEKENTSDSFNR